MLDGEVRIIISVHAMGDVSTALATVVSLSGFPGVSGRQAVETAPTPRLAVCRALRSLLRAERRSVEGVAIKACDVVDQGSELP
jgi:hypothetical protein